METLVFHVLPLILFLLFGACAAHAADELYVVDGEMKGLFCRFFGMACTFKTIHAVSRPNEPPRALPLAYNSVSSSRTTKEGDLRCRIDTKADESKYGKFAEHWNYLTQAPIFYAAKDNGSFENLGMADFIVFNCRRLQ